MMAATNKISSLENMYLDDTIHKVYVYAQYVYMCMCMCICAVSVCVCVCIYAQ